MLGVTLGQCIEKVQHEAGLSANPALGQNFRDKVKHHVRRAHEYYWVDHVWPHLAGDQNNGLFEVLTQAGENLYDFPANLDVTTARDAYVKWSDIWTPLRYGIDQTRYNLSDADDVDTTEDPPMRWVMRSITQFEIWPRPATDDLSIRFRGRSALSSLVNESDVLQLDDSFVVMRAAGYILLPKDKTAASQKFSEADTLYRKIRHNMEFDTKSNMAQGGEPDPRDPRNKVFVGVKAAT